MMFYVGLHQPSDGKHFDRAFISVNRVRGRKKSVGAKSWIMDSGAFTEVSTYGKYRYGVEAYAAEINRWKDDPTLAAVVAQDYMCEPWIVAKTGLSVEEHQRLTIERYDALVPLVAVYVMPVLQGYAAEDYLRHLQMYGCRLTKGAYVGVGSICKRNGDPAQIETILRAIKTARPDLRLHGFGLKTASLSVQVIRDLLYSADSMAWSFAARYEGRNRNDWREAATLVAKIERADTVNLPILTYTLMRDFENCPHKAFRKYVLKDVKYKATPKMAEGTKDHDALMERCKRGVALPRHLRSADPVCAIFDAIPETIPVRVEYMMGILVDGSPCQWDNQAVWMRVKPDIATWSTAGGWIVDWKTGRVWEDPFELECQALMLHSHHPEVPFWQGEYFWTAEGRPGKRYPLDPMAAFARAADAWGKMHAYMAAGEWPKTQNKLCNWCDVKDCQFNTKQD